MIPHSVTVRFARHAKILNTGYSGTGNINDIWTNTKHSILKAAEEVLGKETEADRKKWIGKATLELMDERRRYKNGRYEQEETQYKRLKNEVQRRCSKARNNWIEGKCKEVECYLILYIRRSRRISQKNHRKFQGKTN